MNTLWSTLEQAQRDLMIHSAQDSSFRRLAEFYGFVYQYGFNEGSWRRALLELAYGRRGTKRTTFDVVRHCLRQYDEVFKVTVDPAAPATLTFSQAITDPTLTEFEHRHVNRYIETPWGIVRSVGPRMCNGPSVTLADIETFYWKGATADLWPAEWEEGTPYEFEARFLPFEYYEWQPGPVLRVDTRPNADPQVPIADGYHYGDPCLVDVYVFGDLLPNVPTTYLQPDGVATPVTVPYGGNLLIDEFERGDPRGIGPHPLYLVSPEIFEGLRVQMQAQLAAGVELRLRRALVGSCSP